MALYLLGSCLEPLPTCQRSSGEPFAVPTLARRVLFFVSTIPHPSSPTRIAPGAWTGTQTTAPHRPRITGDATPPRRASRAAKRPRDIPREGARLRHAWSAANRPDHESPETARPTPSVSSREAAWRHPAQGARLRHAWSAGSRAATPLGVQPPTSIAPGSKPHRPRAAGDGTPRRRASRAAKRRRDIPRKEQRPGTRGRRAAEREALGVQPPTQARRRRSRSLGKRPYDDRWLPTGRSLSSP
jgi:hypothetical protein